MKIIIACITSWETVCTYLGKGGGGGGGGGGGKLL